MIWFLLLLLGLWVGIGRLLLFWGGRSKNGEYKRTVEANYCEVEEPVSVTLELTPPALEGPADDHDVVLAIDHSGSMGGGPGSPLQEAKRAAKNFVRQLPSNIHAGVVAFSHRAQLLNPITGDKKRVLHDIEKIGPGGGTAIHEALARCREALVDSRADVDKTAVVLSDGMSSPHRATQAAQRLQGTVPDVNIIAIGFGKGVNKQLMTDLASEDNFYIHVDETEDLYHLFHHLSKVISGKIAISGRVDEQVKDPHPVRLGPSSGLVPSGAHLEENTTRVVWQAPVMDPRSLRLQYEVAPQCAGWYPVATPDGAARWTMPDGSERKDEAPEGPRLLVLPKRWGWAWWLLNPLFWLLVDRFWNCEPPETPSDDSIEEPEPLEEEVPEPLPEPPGRPYTPEPRHALVIGLGDVGRHTIRYLKWHLKNRDVPPSRVDVLSLDVVHPSNQSDDRPGSVPLTSDERLSLHQDLRPYLEDLRTLSVQDDDIPSSRRWVPWREWLADLDPSSTVRSLDDRRKARLALLLQPDAVEERLQQHVERLQKEEGQIIVTGSPSDPECSGMLAEVAHVCATNHEAVTGVFAPSNDAEAGTQALVEEVERMMQENGTGVLSDRGLRKGTSTISARRLFDRIVSAAPDDVSSAGRSKATADLLWCMLAYEEDLDVPPVTPDESPIRGTQIQYDAVVPPAGVLWEWVREDALARSINETWLGLNVRDDHFSLPDLDRDTVQQDVEAFWTGGYNDRPLNRIVAQSRRLSEGSTIETILDLGESEEDDRPGLAQRADRPYHEQADFCEVQRAMFGNYLAEWAHRILKRERDEGHCGLQRLWVALEHVGEEFTAVANTLRDHTGTGPFSDTAHLAVGLFADFERIRSSLVQDVQCWLSAFIGASPKLELEDAHADQTPVCYDLEAGRKEALRALPPSTNVREEARAAWTDDFGHSMEDQLRFAVEENTGTGTLSLTLNVAGESFECREDVRLTEHLREDLDQYRRYLLDWVSETQFPEEEPVPNPGGRVRIGKREDVFPTVTSVCNDDDPLVAAALAVREEPLETMLGVAGAINGTPPYAWPEEANQRRLARKIRNTLHLDIEFPSAIAHLLRNTRGLFGFMGDIARENLQKRDHAYRLARGEDVFVLAQDLGTGLAVLTTLAEQVVLIQEDRRGNPLPPASSWTVEAENAVEAVNGSRLGQQFAREPGWEKWEALIRGLALEHGKQKKQLHS